MSRSVKATTGKKILLRWDASFANTVVSLKETLTGPGTASGSGVDRISPGLATERYDPASGSLSSLFKASGTSSLGISGGPVSTTNPSVPLSFSPGNAALERVLPDWVTSVIYTLTVRGDQGEVTRTVGFFVGGGQQVIELTSTLKGSSSSQTTFAPGDRIVLTGQLPKRGATYPKVRLLGNDSNYVNFPFNNYDQTTGQFVAEVDASISRTYFVVLEELDANNNSTGWQFVGLRDVNVGSTPIAVSISTTTDSAVSGAPFTLTASSTGGGTLPATPSTTPGSGAVTTSRAGRAGDISRSWECTINRTCVFTVSSAPKDGDPPKAERSTVVIVNGVPVTGTIE